MTIRLNKLLAQRGLGARRKCDLLIQQGQVRVNGDVVREPGTQVDPAHDRVVVGGRVLPRESERRYFVLNKPVGIITTLDDPQGRRTVAEFMPPGTRLFPVGRLDADTSGLLMLTNDGELAHHLMHPRYGVDKTYRIHVDRPPTPGQLERLRRGVEFEPGVRSAPADARLLEGGGEGALLQLTIHEGRYRQVRRMCEAVGLYVNALHRSGYGPLRLGPLPRGMWRELSDEEVERLREASARPRERGQHGWAGARRGRDRGAGDRPKPGPRPGSERAGAMPGGAPPRRPSTARQAFAARVESFERTGRSAPADWGDVAPRERASRPRPPQLDASTEREARRRFGVPARPRDAAERAERTERGVRAERTERGVRAERTERGVRAPRAEGGARTPREERGGARKPRERFERGVRPGAERELRPRVEGGSRPSGEGDRRGRAERAPRAGRPERAPRERTRRFDRRTSEAPGSFAPRGDRPANRAPRREGPPTREGRGERFEGRGERAAGRPATGRPRAGGRVERRPAPGRPTPPGRGDRFERRPKPGRPGPARRGERFERGSGAGPPIGRFRTERSGPTASRRTQPGRPERESARRGAPKRPARPVRNARGRR